jgi:enoyl-[acyl-carrier-protein] reductase (NADH)
MSETAPTIPAEKLVKVYLKMRAAKADLEAQVKNSTLVEE